MRVGPASTHSLGRKLGARAPGAGAAAVDDDRVDESMAAIVEAARAARRSVIWPAARRGGRSSSTSPTDWVEQSRLLHREGFVGALEKAVSLEAVRDTMAGMSKWPGSCKAVLREQRAGAENAWRFVDTSRVAFGLLETKS